MAAVWLILGLLLCAAEAARRTRHQVMVLDMQLTMDMNIGTPALLCRAKLDSATADLIVMDIGCNDPRPLVHCPKYCDDDLIKSVFCSALCTEYSRAETIIRCAATKFYFPNASTTFRDKRTEVERKFRRQRPLTGRLASDSFSLMTEKVEKAVGEKRQTLNLFEIPQLEFIRVFRFDSSHLLFHTAMLGLAPQSAVGHPSLVPQLKAAGVLDRAAITIHSMNSPILISSFMVLNFAYGITFGTPNQYNCRNWRLFPANSVHDWDFRITSLRFAGVLFSNWVTGQIDLKQRYITIPAEVAEQLMAAGIVSVDSKDFISLTDPTAEPTLEFSVGEQKVVFESEWLRRSNKGLRMKVGPPVEYLDDQRWSFGHDLLDWICYGYDYDRGVVLWADRRTLPINDN